MKSKIFVENDFDHNDPYIQLYITDDSCDSNERPDMRDTVLKNFLRKGQKYGIEVYLPENIGPDSPQLRIVKPKIASSYVPPIDWSKEIETNHVKINAKRHQGYGEDSFYKNGESYNLMFSTADNNCVIIKYGGVVVTDQDTFWRYTSLAQFLEYWTVNSPKE